MSHKTPILAMATLLTLSTTTLWARSPLDNLPPHAHRLDVGRRIPRGEDRL